MKRLKVSYMQKMGRGKLPAALPRMMILAHRKSRVIIGSWETDRVVTTSWQGYNALQPEEVLQPGVRKKRLRAGVVDEGGDCPHSLAARLLHCLAIL